MIRPPRYGSPARTLRLRLLLVPQDETFPWCNLSSRPASPLCGASFLPASPLRHHHAVTRFGCLRKPRVNDSKHWRDRAAHIRALSETSPPPRRYPLRALEKTKVCRGGSALGVSKLPELLKRRQD